MNREEAIKIVKSHYPANKQMLNEALEFLIPELKESEDEKIRKDLITFLDEIWHLGKNANFDKWDKSDCSNWIAWLEKQKEFVSADFDDVWETADCDELTAPLEKYSKDAIKKMCHAWYDKGIELERKNWIEKQGEQAPSQTNERAWLYLVSDVLTWKDGIGQYLDDPRVQELAKRLCSEYTQKLYNSSVLSNSSNIGKNEHKQLITLNHFEDKNDMVEPKFKIGDKIIEKNFDECGCGTVIDIKDGKYYFDDGNFIWIKEQGLWKLVEQNHTDKIETKFKVGDWIITSENKVLQITSIEDTRYRFNNESRYWEIYYCDKECRLWTIEDAKPGDIIYAESKFATFDFIVIFSKLENKNVGVYCGVSSDSDDYSDGLDHWEFDNTKGFIEMDRYNFYPVSKEQRDLLFTKMKEAGYEWAKKPKELK